MTAEFEGHYVLWQIKRLNWILKYLPLEQIQSTNLLELGCGYGFFGTQFSRLGANVLCVDGRSEHIQHINKNMSRTGDSSVQTKIVNLDNDFSYLGKFDIIIDMGLLYHLEFPEEHILCLTRMMHDKTILILESIVSDYDRPLTFTREEQGYDQSLTSKAKILSAAMVEELLNCYSLEFEDISSSELNASMHKYDWSYNNSYQIHNGKGLYFRRMWLVRKKEISSISSEKIDQIKLLQDQVKELNLRLSCLQLSKDAETAHLELVKKQNKLLSKENHDLHQQIKQHEKIIYSLSSKGVCRPADIIDALIDRTLNKNQEVAIFGAGEHTEYLFQETKIKNLNPSVIFDNDRSKWSLNYNSIPIKDPRLINQLNLDIIIISSERYEKEIYSQIKNILATNTVVIKLYENYD